MTPKKMEKLIRQARSKYLVDIDSLWPNLCRDSRAAQYLLKEKYDKFTICEHCQHRLSTILKEGICWKLSFKARVGIDLEGTIENRNIPMGN